MKALTKNHQSQETLQAMVEKCFPGLHLQSYKELTEGYFNVAYDVVLSNGKHTILKVAPKKDTRVMTYEKNIMFAEVEAMKLVTAHDGIPAPKVFAYDNTCNLCDSPYFFMEKLEGETLNNILNTLTEAQISSIRQELGKINSRINFIKRDYFGYPGLPEFHGDKWYPTFVKMMKTAVNDNLVANVDLQIPLDTMWECLEADKAVFEEVTEPCLIHWDCWDGNIFVKEGKITGIIDWERSMFADPLMEVSFREYAYNPDFYQGYGILELTPNQKRRALWYDIYMMILGASECEYRQYETMDMYHWAMSVMHKQFPKIAKREA